MQKIISKLQILECLGLGQSLYLKQVAGMYLLSKVSLNCLFSMLKRSPHYASPEVVQGITYDGEKADIWSCGVILFALVSGKLPFDNENIRILLGKVKTGVFTMPAFLPKDVQDLISKMLVVDPKKRITMDGIRNHPWYTSSPPDTEPSELLEKVKSSNRIFSLKTNFFPSQCKLRVTSL